MLDIKVPEILKEFYSPLTGSSATKEHLKAMGYSENDSFWVRTTLKIFHKAVLDKDFNFSLRKTRLSSDLKENGKRIETYHFQKDGLSYVQNFAKTNINADGYLEGDILYNIHNFDMVDTKDANFVSRRSLTFESDLLDIQSQIDNIAWIAEITGVLPNSIVFTGSKSLHAHYLLPEGVTEEDYQKVFCMICALVTGDPSMDDKTRCSRLPGVARVNKNDVTLLYYRSGKCDFKKLLRKLDEYWLERYYSITPTRYQKYKSSVKAVTKLKNDIAKNLKEGLSTEGLILDENKFLKNPLDAFTLTEYEFETKFKTTSTREKREKQDYYAKKGDTPLYRFVNEVLAKRLDLMSDDDRFSGYPYDIFTPTFKTSDRSTSPFSPTNSSGTSLKLYPTGGWKCYASGYGGDDATSYLGRLWFDTEGMPKGKDYKKFAEMLAVKVNVDFESGLAEYNRASKIYPSTINIKESNKTLYDETVSDSYEFLSLDLPEDSKKSSSPRTPKTILGMVLKNPEYATALKESFQSDFINIKTPNIAVVKELQERGITDVRVYVQPGDIQKSSMMMGYHQLSEVLKDFNIRFEWHGQSETHHKFAHEIENKLKFITFEKLCYLSTSLSNKKARSEAFEKISGCSEENVIHFSERYVSDAEIVMESGKITMIDSPMGSGKTHFLRMQAEEFVRANPEKSIISIGHRNGLQRAIAKDCNLKMFIEDRGNGFNNKLALAIDSVRHIPLGFFKGAFIILDEAEAMLHHVICSETIKSRRKACLTRFQEGLKYCLETGGKVYASEANISDFTFENLKVLGIKREQINFYKNDFAAIERCILVNNGVIDTSISDIRERVKAGGKVLVATDCAKTSEEVDGLLKKDNPDVKVILVNQDTSNEDLVKEFLENPDATIAREQPDCVIYSPTLDSGGDISKPYFDEVFGLFSTLETRVQLQMIFRCRVDIPIQVFVKESANNSKDSNEYAGFDVEELKGLYRKGSIVFDKNSNGTNFYKGWLEEEDSLFELISRANDDETLEGKLLEIFCKFEVRANLARADMRDNLLKALRKTHIVEVLDMGVIEGKKEESDIIKEEILDRKSEEFANADTSSISVATAEKILDSNCAKREDVVKAKKKVFEDKYPDIELSKGFVKKMVVKNNGEGVKRANELAIVMYPEMAEVKEKASWESQKKSEMILLWDVKLVYQKSMLVNSLNFLETVYKACEEGTFHKNNPDLISLAQEMAYKSKEFKRLYKITINPKLSPVKVISGFCKKLGIKLEVVKRSVESDGSRTYIYSIVKDEDYDFTMQMVAAIKKNFDEKGVKEEVVKERSETFITPENDIADIESSDTDDFDFLDVREQEVVRSILEKGFEKNSDIPLNLYKIAFGMASENFKSNKELKKLYA